MAKEHKLLSKTEKPQKLAIKLHSFYKGKIEIIPKCRIKSFNDFAIWYTPGVASPCKAIESDKSLVYEYTNKWNTIAVVTNGTRVLGLGDIGPEAALPVMEGKSLLFKYLGGVDAIPLCLNTKDPDELIRTVKLLQPSFGGINLEDISQPGCFRILDVLRKECEIPVWHDDQQGTATVTLAGLINALKIVRKKISEVKIAMVGAGAANICIANMLISAGADAGNIVMCDSKGILHKDRVELKEKYKEKWQICLRTNRNNIRGTIPDAMENADVLIALSTPCPDTIKKEWIKSMNSNPIVFVCANPVPEIWPWLAKEAGAKIVATGRSDFPNQVNNSIGFPAIFRGTLDVRAKTITNEMCIVAANELAKVQEKQGLDEEHILPTMDNREAFICEAVAVGMKAIEQGIAGINLSKEELRSKVKQIITRAQKEVKLLMNKGIIKT